MHRLLSLFAALAPLALCAQIAINPQVGAAFTTLAPEQEGLTNNARFLTYYATVGVVFGGSTSGSDSTPPAN